MADPHHTRERAAWVTAHAARRPEWQRRGQRLTTRARRATRYEVGAGDAGAADELGHDLDVGTGDDFAPIRGLEDVRGARG